MNITPQNNTAFCALSKKAAQSYLNKLGPDPTKAQKRDLLSLAENQSENKTFHVHFIEPEKKYVICTARSISKYNSCKNEQETRTFFQPLVEFGEFEDIKDAAKQANFLEFNYGKKQNSDETILEYCI